MARGTDQCGGETSSTNIINEYGNLALACGAAPTRLPRGMQTLEASANGPRSGPAGCFSKYRIHFSTAQVKRVRLRSDGSLSRPIRLPGYAILVRDMFYK